MPYEIPHNALIVVADGKKALLLRNEGTETRLVLREESRISFRDVVNDGPSGKRPAEETPKETDEATFAKRLVKRLASLREAGDVPALVLAADPQTLGEMRAAMHKGLEQAILFTLAKDLTNSPLPDVTHQLALHSMAQTRD